MSIFIRRASPSDRWDFAELMVISAPHFFPMLYGEDVKLIMSYLFARPHNLFSFQHVLFAEVEGEKAGMILGYDRLLKRREEARTGFLLALFMKLDFIKKLLNFMRAKGAVGKVNEGEYYISNLAVYPDFRGIGVGSGLLLEAEKKAKEEGATWITLDVETINSTAIKLYRRFGYRVVGESSIRLEDETFHFLRMCKRLGDR